jgi:hypothetical protein
MKALLFISLGTILFCQIGCGANSQKNDTDAVKSIKIDYVIPQLSADSQLVNESRSISIYYYKTFVIYKIESFFSNQLNTGKMEDDTMVFRINNWEKRFKYFIFDSKQSYGYKYDSLGAKSGRKILVDSFLSSQMVNQLDPLYLNAHKNDSIVATIKNANGDVLLKYITKSKPDFNYPDSTFLYFTNNPTFKSVDFSLSRSADSIMKMKLYNIRVIYNKNPGTGDPFGKLAKELSFEIKENPVENKKEIVDFIDRFANS